MKHIMISPLLAFRSIRASSLTLRSCEHRVKLESVSAEGVPLAPYTETDLEEYENMTGALETPKAAI